VRLADEQVAALEKASAIELGFPHDMLARPLARSVVFGDITLEGLEGLEPAS